MLPTTRSFARLTIVTLTSCAALFTPVTFASISPLSADDPGTVVSSAVTYNGREFLFGAKQGVSFIKVSIGTYSEPWQPLPGAPLTVVGAIPYCNAIYVLGTNPANQLFTRRYKASALATAIYDKASFDPWHQIFTSDADTRQPIGLVSFNNHAYVIAKKGDAYQFRATDDNRNIPWVDIPMQGLPHPVGAAYDGKLYFFQFQHANNAHQYAAYDGQKWVKQGSIPAPSGANGVTGATVYNDLLYIFSVTPNAISSKTYNNSTPQGMNGPSIPHTTPALSVLAVAYRGALHLFASGTTGTFQHTFRFNNLAPPSEDELGLIQPANNVDVFDGPDQVADTYAALNGRTIRTRSRKASIDYDSGPHVDIDRNTEVVLQTTTNSCEGSVCHYLTLTIGQLTVQASVPCLRIFSSKHNVLTAVHSKVNVLARSADRLIITVLDGSADVTDAANQKTVVNRLEEAVLVNGTLVAITGLTPEAAESRTNWQLDLPLTIQLRDTCGLNIPSPFNWSLDELLTNISQLRSTCSVGLSLSIQDGTLDIAAEQGIKRGCVNIRSDAKSYDVCDGDLGRVLRNVLESQ